MCSSCSFYHIFLVLILATCLNWAVILLDSNNILSFLNNTHIVFWSLENTSLCKNRQSILGLQDMTKTGPADHKCNILTTKKGEGQMK